MNNQKIESLIIEKIDPPGESTRTIIDPDKIRELAESIRETGLLQPILCRPVNGRYEVVAGHRRFLAHLFLGEVKINAIVKEMNDNEVEVVRAVENDQREDLNPIEKGRVYKKLKEKHGMTQEEIAKKMGRSRETIIRFMQLLEVPEEYHKAIANGALSIGVALALREIDDEKFQKFYYTAAIENGVTLEVAKKWVYEYMKTKYGNVEGYGGMGPGGVAEQETLPIYQTCACCTGAVEVRKVKYLPICPDCETQVRGALKVN